MKTLSALALTSLWGILGVSPAFAQMTVVNGASFDSSQPVAPGSFATMFGQNLCSQTMAGNWIAAGQLPTTLGGCSNHAPTMPSARATGSGLGNKPTLVDSRTKASSATHAKATASCPLRAPSSHAFASRCFTVHRGAHQG